MRSTSPRSALTCPARIRRRVDLPSPFRPSKQIRSFFSMVIPTSSSKRGPPKETVRSPIAGQSHTRRNQEILRYSLTSKIDAGTWKHFLRCSQPYYERPALQLWQSKWCKGMGIWIDTTKQPLSAARSPVSPVHIQSHWIGIKLNDLSVGYGSIDNFLHIYLIRLRRKSRRLLA